MDLSALADFNLVAVHGGLGKASRASGRPKATLSRRIMELEANLGVRLLERGARSLRLTEQGALLYARTEGLLAEIAEVGEAVIATTAQPRGCLRISAPTLFAHIALGRLAAQFVAAYPEVTIEITAEDRIADLVEEGFDLAIRINPRPTEGWVGRCLLRDQMLVVAPGGMPRPAQSCDRGRPPSVPAVVLSTAPQTPVWTLAGSPEPHCYEADPVLRLSSMLMVRDAVRAGAGAAQLPVSLVAEDLASGNLESWGEVSDRPIEIWALHTSRRLVSAKVTAFMQFLGDAFPQGGFA